MLRGVAYHSKDLLICWTLGAAGVEWGSLITLITAKATSYNVTGQNNQY